LDEAAEASNDSSLAPVEKSINGKFDTTIGNLESLKSFFQCSDAHLLNLLSFLKVLSVLMMPLNGTSEKTLQTLRVLSGEFAKVLDEVGKRVGSLVVLDLFS
jgi:hypothetical protein